MLKSNQIIIDRDGIWWVLTDGLYRCPPEMTMKQLEQFVERCR